MKLMDLMEVLDAELVWAPKRPDWGDRAIESCHASDLMSDVLTFRGPGSLLLTGLTNAQVVRTAEILDFVAVCFVRGKGPQDETVKLAEEKGMPLLATPLSMFESCGRLFAQGVPGGRKEEVAPIA